MIYLQQDNHDKLEIRAPESEIIRKAKLTTGNSKIKTLKDVYTLLDSNEYDTMIEQLHSNYKV